MYLSQHFCHVLVMLVYVAEHQGVKHSNDYLGEEQDSNQCMVNRVHLSAILHEDRKVFYIQIFMMEQIINYSNILDLSLL